jgi:hypothetical protein
MVVRGPTILTRTLRGGQVALHIFSNLCLSPETERTTRTAVERRVE